jgi:hypothetical protein
MPNTALLLDALTHLETHPELISTRAWIDGDTACLAGRIVLLAGAYPVMRGLRTEIGRTVAYHGRHRDVAELAIELTEVSVSEGRWLFHWERSLPEQIRGLTAICADLAIPGRPYWSLTDTDQRYADDRGTITVARQRRTVFYLDDRTWRHVHTIDAQDAEFLARQLAADARSHLLTIRPVHTSRSLTS